jgi:hypothetical protein
MTTRSLGTINGLYKAEVIWRRGSWRSAEISELLIRLVDDLIQNVPARSAQGDGVAPSLRRELFFERNPCSEILEFGNKIQSRRTKEGSVLIRTPTAAHGALPTPDELSERSTCSGHLS